MGEQRSFTDKAVGAGEAALTMLTGATSGAAGYLASAPQGAINEITGSGEGMENAQAMAAQNTYSPRTEAGKEYVQWLGETLGVLPPTMGLGGRASVRVPRSGKQVKAGVVNPPIKMAGMARDGIFKTAAAKKKLISDELLAGNVNAGNIAKALNEDGKLITNPNIKKAVKMMGNDASGIASAINLEKMNGPTRKVFNEMLDSIDRNKASGDPLDIMTDRPSNAIGNAIAKRAIDLNEIKTKASEDIGKVINGAYGDSRVKIEVARDGFINKLAEADIAVGQSDTGKLIADTTRTLTNIEEVIPQGKLNNILNRLQSGEMTAKEAHKMKRNLREMVSFDNAAMGSVKVSAEIESAIKTLASEIGDVVAKGNKQYAKANAKMANSLDALKKTDKLLGKSIMIGDDLAVPKLGALSKRIGTNLASKEAVLDMVQSLDGALERSGKAPKDDIPRLVASLPDLEKIFKVESAQAPFGLQSRIAQGAMDSAVTGGNAS